MINHRTLAAPYLKFPCKGRKEHWQLRKLGVIIVDEACMMGCKTFYLIDVVLKGLKCVACTDIVPA